jgi:Virulence factor
MNITYQIVYWRDIPAQLKVKSGSSRINRQLSPRFQEAIDAAAMRAGATNTDDYLADWHSSDLLHSEGNPDQLAEQVASQIEAEYTPERLKKLIANRGFEAD